jgi:hypothetical protein
LTSPTTTRAFLLRASLRTAAREARHAAREARHAARKARHAARNPSRLTAGIAATAAVGAVVVAAPWTSGTSSHAASGARVSAPGLALAAGHQATHQATGTSGKAAASSGPSTIYDSVTPAAIPSGQQVATYSDGPYQASSSDVAGRGKVLWIDTNGSNTRADALDVEPGDATPAGAAQWVSAKLAKAPRSTAIVYTFKNDWSQVISNIDALPARMQSHVKYWIADPTGTPHIVPGASATQWYWGSSYDITAATPGFFS